MRKMLAQELRDEDNDKQVSRTNGALFVANQCNKVHLPLPLHMTSCLPPVFLARLSLPLSLFDIFSIFFNFRCFLRSIPVR
jgi:hypothetical protein